MPIKKLSKGKYTGILAWNGSIYLTGKNEKGEEVKLAECGTYCALNEYERYKSWAFVDYSYILYEEFITDGVYLNDEPRLLQQFVSTVARLKRITVILIGNTLSRVCPYFNEWCLEGVLKQKQGTIEVYHFHVDDSVIDIVKMLMQKTQCFLDKHQNKLYQVNGILKICLNYLENNMNTRNYMKY